MNIPLKPAWNNIPNRKHRIPIRMNLQRMYEWVYERALEAANQWFTEQCANPSTALYLYYKIGELQVATRCPDGFRLASGERLSPNMNRDQQQANIVHIARQLPILPDMIP